MAEKICVVGTGYVGLVTGVGLAALGHAVVCVDVDTNKIERLKQGHLPIYEPGLEALVRQTVAEGYLAFSAHCQTCMQQADIIIIAVGTPTTETGAAELRFVFDVVDTLVAVLDRYKIIVVKSTVPVGTCAQIRDRLCARGVPTTSFDVVSNPEFLREGSAIHDFMHPDRIVLGGAQAAVQRLQDMYRTLIGGKAACLCTSLESAELTKYASNAMLALRVAFMNEIARLCNSVGADVRAVAQGMGMDKRIGGAFLRPGPGFGGSCFPKDVKALAHMFGQYRVRGARVIPGIVTANETHKRMLLQRMRSLAGGNLAGKKVALLGLTFKANTDDVRDSFALEAIAWLKSQGAIIAAYDPQGARNMSKLHADIFYACSVQEAVQDAELIVLITEWDEFKSIDIGQLAGWCKKKCVLDLRNIFEPAELARYGFIFYNLGRRSKDEWSRL